MPKVPPRVLTGPVETDLGPSIGLVITEPAVVDLTDPRLRMNSLPKQRSPIFPLEIHNLANWPLHNKGALSKLANRPIRPVANELDRRWISDDYFDLIVWHDSSGRIHGFQQ